MFSEFSVRAQQWRDFATAHSCGLRRVRSLRCMPSRPPLPQRIRAGCDIRGERIKTMINDFATAHSCGLRLAHCRLCGNIANLCHSAFVRVATYGD